MAWIIYNKDTLEILRIEGTTPTQEPIIAENEGLETPLVLAVFNSEVSEIPPRPSVDYTVCIFYSVTGGPKWVIE